MKRLIALLLIALLCCACSPTMPEGLLAHLPDYPKAIKPNDADARIALREANPVEADFTDALVDFSARSAAQILPATEGNALYSPLSLAYALTLCAAGANGQTQIELLAALGVDNLDTPLTQCGNLWRRLCCINDHGRLSIASSVWLNDKSGLTFSPAFLEPAQQLYASLYRADFTDPAMPDALQSWGKTATAGQLVPHIDLSPDAALVLLSTLDFAGEWIDRFDKNKTEAGVFHAVSGDKTIDFLHRTYSTHSFSRGEKFTRSGLSTKNGATIYFILPEEGISVDALTASAEALDEALFGGEAGCGEVVWAIPKFDFTATLDLLPALRALGIESALAQETADFSGIVSETLPAANHLFISAVSQQNRISIDENGIEAASFTQITYAGAPMPTGRADMILDRPFLFAVVREGLPLFIGVCREG